MRMTSQQALGHDWLASAERNAPLADQEEQAMKAWRLMNQLSKLSEPQRLALATCAMACTEADLASGPAWRGLFMLLDEDNDGCLSIAELCTGLRKVGGVLPEEASLEELTEAANVLDIDGSGAVDWAEWIALALLQMDFSQAEAIVQTAFRLLDRPPGRVQSKVSSSINAYVCELKGKENQDVCSLEDFRMVLASCQGRRV